MASESTQSDRSFLGALRLSAVALGIGALTTVLATLSGPVPRIPPASIVIETEEQILPPVALGERSFTIAVRKQRLGWPLQANVPFDPDDHETAESFEIRDAEGRTLFRQRVVDDPRELDPSRVRDEGRFSFSYSVRPYVLKGSSGQALMIDWYFFPSAPSACSTHWILGIVDDELVPFAEPFCATVERPSHATPSGWQLDNLAGEEVLEIRWRSPYFSLILPVAVDFDAGKLLPSGLCQDLHCEVPVQAQRQPVEEETRVRLFPRPDLDTASPRIVAVNRGSEVEFLSALAPSPFDAQGHWNPPADPDRTYWLRVRVDGDEGWVWGEADLFALGLRAAG